MYVKCNIFKLFRDYSMPLSSRKICLCQINQKIVFHLDLITSYEMLKAAQTLILYIFSIFPENVEPLSTVRSMFFKFVNACSYFECWIFFYFSFSFLLFCMYIVITLCRDYIRECEPQIGQQCSKHYYKDTKRPNKSLTRKVNVVDC